MHVRIALRAHTVMAISRFCFLISLSALTRAHAKESGFASLKLLQIDTDFDTWKETDKKVLDVGGEFRCLDSKDEWITTNAEGDGCDLTKTDLLEKAKAAIEEEPSNLEGAEELSNLEKELSNLEEELGNFDDWDSFMEDEAPQSGSDGEEQGASDEEEQGASKDRRPETSKEEYPSTEKSHATMASALAALFSAFLFF